MEVVCCAARAVLESIMMEELVAALQPSQSFPRCWHPSSGVQQTCTKVSVCLSMRVVVTMVKGSSMHMLSSPSTNSTAPTHDGTSALPLGASPAIPRIWFQSETWPGFAGEGNSEAEPEEAARK
eukprot:724117-Rhodomonas_salina.2